MAWWTFSEKQTKIPGWKQKKPWGRGVELEQFFCAPIFSHVNYLVVIFPISLKTISSVMNPTKHVSDYIPSSGEQPTSALVAKIALEVVEPAGVRTEGSDLKSFDNREPRNYTPRSRSAHLGELLCVTSPFQKVTGAKVLWIPDFPDVWVPDVHDVNRQSGSTLFLRRATRGFSIHGCLGCCETVREWRCDSDLNKGYLSLGTRKK